MDSKARFKNSRIKSMLERCTDRFQSNVKSNEETQPPLHQLQPGTEVCRENPPCGSKSLAKSITTAELVNSIYAADYSMTSSIFRKFNETKTSLDLGLNFSDMITTISAADLPSTSKEKALICNEIMPPMSLEPSPSGFPTEICDAPYASKNNVMMSPTPSNNSAGDFCSDDSVKDKDYCPSDEISSDDCDGDDESSARSRHTKSVNDNVSHLEPRQENNSIPEAGPILEAGPIPETGPLSSGAVNNSNNKNRSSVRERKLKQKQEKKLTYNVKIACNEKCIKKCSTKLTPNARETINKYYWALSWKERRIFIQNSTAVAIPKRKVTSEPKRAPRSTFSLKNLNGTNVEVCKTFFLTTLGFNKNNDTVLYNSLNKNPVDRRGLHIKTAPFDRKLLTGHVESFHPLEPHYRREHAPLRRYISCDVTVTLMHKDFCEKYPSQNVSYELYRRHVKSMNISFAKLGNEECEVCEANELHAKNTSHDVNNGVPENCESCALYVCHRTKYKKARELYETQKNYEQSLENIYYSVDLQKVIMLPRVDSFKSIIFCPRLTTFNLSFAPVGKITNQNKPLACIWHDGTSGRKQEDIMSCYYYFVLQYRDVKNIIIWMDNCSAQNKNWLLFSLMIFLINSDLIATETITFQYFEPGHTFMSCDQFHHQVELAMKKKGKLYDFQDFTECVSSANLARVDVKTMEPKDFFSFPNYVSERRIQSSTPRVYLKDIIQVCFQRQNYDILYKNEVDDENYKVLRFMTDKYLRNIDILKPEFKGAPKGIDKKRKDEIIKSLKDICAPHKLQFWHDMPEA